MKRTRISVLLVIALLLQLYAPLTAGAADFTPNPQTEYAKRFIAACDGQTWFINEIERLLNVQQRTLDTITGAEDLVEIKSIGLIGQNITGHIPAAIGVLVGRVIYPSYGIMLLCSRISSLLFFALCIGAIIKKSTVGKWTLFMLFSIPCIQKLASPSYDVFSYVVFAMYSMNIFELAKLRTIKEISKQKILYTLITIILLLFCKKNYLFALAVIPFLPMFFLRILEWLDNKKMSVKIVIFVSGIIVMLVLLVGLNYYLNLFSLFKAFMKSYFNMATMGDRGKSLFSVVPTILPEIFNLLWIVSTFLIVLGENAYNWYLWFTFGGLLAYLEGRYLHPYKLYFVPALQRFSKRNKIKVNSTTIAALAIITVVIIYSVYLFTCFYRGFILNITATWVS